LNSETKANDPDLELVLKRAEALFEAANAMAFALEDLGSIELPPITSSSIDQAQLRAIATLYLASELEAAGLIPAIENLMRLTRLGRLQANMGDAAPMLHAFWQRRNERATADERKSFYSSLFGASYGTDHSEYSSNSEFEDRLIDLCESLYKLDELATNDRWGGVAQQTRVRHAAQALLANLVQVSSGITVFFAKDILLTVKNSLAILNHPSVKAAFGSRTLWQVVEAIYRQMGKPVREHALHVRRGQSGMTILAWLADAVPSLESTQPLLGLDHPVVSAAIDWLEASLTLSEHAASSYGNSRNNGTSSWAALAG